MQIVPVICIDGPSGAGKGTLSLQLADYLGWHLLDSGALYRVLGLACSQSAVALDDALAVAAMARSLDVLFQSVSRESESGWATVTLRPQSELRQGGAVRPRWRCMLKPVKRSY